jgi:hypothetical protein
MTKSKQQLLDYVQSLEIVIPDLTKKVLVRQACAHYNEYNRSIGRQATPKDPDEFIFRITVNYLRHETTRYEHELERMAGHVAEREAHDALKEKILDAIAVAYPWIRKECAAQKQKVKDDVRKTA